MSMDNRRKEMFEDIDDHIPDAKHRDMVKAATGPYIAAARDDKLFKQLAAIVKDGVGSRKPQVDDKWTAQLQRAIDAMGVQLEAVRKAAKNLPEALTATERRLADEEESFRQAAAKMIGVGAQVDVILQLHLDLEQKGKDLVATWNQQADDFEDFEQEMVAAQKDIRALVDDAVAKVAEKHKTIQERAVQVADFLGKADADGKPTLSELLKALGDYSALAKLVVGLRDVAAVRMMVQGKVAERMARLEREMSKRGVGIVMFCEVRESVEEFVDKVNVNTSVAAVGKIQAMLAQAVTACPTPGQKRDMAAFTKDIGDIVKAAHEDLVDAYDDFVDAHKGKFLGTISDSTMKVLLNADRFKKDQTDIRVSRLNDVLQRVYKYDYISFTLRNYRGDHRSGIESYLRREVGGLYEQLKREDAELGKLSHKQDQLLRLLEDAKRKVS